MKLHGTSEARTGTLASSEEPDEMPHHAAFSSGSALFAKTKSIFREINEICLL